MHIDITSKSSLMELLNIVNERDEVIGMAPRTRVYTKNLRHRIVHILLTDDEGRLILQKRSNTVTFCPNHWSTTVGGHVWAWESYLEAAIREKSEEIWKEADTTELIEGDKILYTTQAGCEKFITIFHAKLVWILKPNPDEVSEVKSFSDVEIKTMLTDGTLIHPELRYILEQRFATKK